MDTGVRTCTSCSQEKPLSEFLKAGHSKDGRHSWCKPCARRESKEYERTKRMFVAGKRIPKSEPNWKPGRYPSWDSVFKGTPIENTENPIIVDPTLKRIREENAEEIAKFNNKQTSKAEGYVYVITNPAWPVWCKVGCALDYEDRFRSYQTYSPFRDYQLVHSRYFSDRRSAEYLAKRELQEQVVEFQNEWFNCTPAEAIDVIERL